MDFLIKLAEGFTGVFNAGGENLIGLVTGILPNLLVLLTFINSLVVLIGEERVARFSQKLTKYTIFRTTLLPFCSLFFLSNPMGFTMGRFLKEEQKPAFIDTVGTIAHPMTGIFPHGNPGELFVWIGISSGITTLGLSTSPLAVRYLIAGFIVCFIRGTITEMFTKRLMKSSDAKEVAR
ncbi:PTS sorbitol transporter subunit IIC [Enterococcus florum]|uniref:PTS sorbitol transporter subunit IIC n=1 Tax=Enterococcus florum TaxID=2480627 RepID=A0A4P5PJD4_9ENTE|nr:PTS glucitol/sorbitol transporter subunit IIC [Enterococcus florum]GCF95702.1 PTS sorbitol transporter subunit IIC [Enterococcus florum]